MKRCKCRRKPEICYDVALDRYFVSCLFCGLTAARRFAEKDATKAWDERKELHAPAVG